MWLENLAFVSLFSLGGEFRGAAMREFSVWNQGASASASHFRSEKNPSYSHFQT